MTNDQHYRSVAIRKQQRYDPAMLFDTHVHFDGLAAGGVDDVIRRAVSAGVPRMIAVGGNSTANAFAVDCAERFPENLRAAVGYDRDQAQILADPNDRASAMAALETEISVSQERGRVVAIGEIGLDLHYSPETADAQAALLRDQLALARRFGLPVIVHTRNADSLTLAELTAHAAAWKESPDRIGVIHCFTGDAAFAAHVLKLGFHISFSGILTFRNADALRSVAQVVPEDRLLVETDSPLLAPVPHRGKPNEPMYLPRIVETLARLRKSTIERVAEITSANASRLFRCPL
jgi:TatD DNase family protein